MVEVSNTSGMVDVSGWDRHEVSVHGDLDEGVERVDVTSEAGRTLIKVVLPEHSFRGGEAPPAYQGAQGQRAAPDDRQCRCDRGRGQRAYSG